MIKKIIILIVAALAIAFITDYSDRTDTPSYKGKVKVFETRDDFLYKSKKRIDSELK